MLQILHDTNVPFMKWRRYAYVFSGACVLATALWLLIHHGPRLSVDFTGGTMMRVAVSRSESVDAIRKAFDKAGYHGAEIQTVGEQGMEFLVRLGHQEGAEGFARAKQAIETDNPGVTAELRGQTAVGPKVGSELASRALWAIVLSILGILVY